MPTHSAILAALVGAALLLSACGNRGPLTLPQKPITAASATEKSAADHSSTPTPPPSR
ncbi:MAG: lipoprotein [Rhodocyclaceae bacterium]|nr:lipoprotein [Rhodocyclaceae bacterium]